MTYEYYSNLGETLSGSAFHSFTSTLFKKFSVENRLQLGNFYHTINLKAKTSVMKRAWDNDTLITVWEE